MSEPRLKTEFRIAAQLRRAASAGAFATVARRGDADAGAVAVKVYLGARRARLFVESRDEKGDQIWCEPLGGEADEVAVDRFLDQETRFDHDLWIVEIEDRHGRAFVD